jgi:hypothetical protein
VESGLARMTKNDVLPVRVGRRRHGEREEVWHASKDITYSLWASEGGHMVSGKRSGMHQRTSRTCYESGEAETWLTERSLACIKRHPVPTVRVRRGTHGEWEVVWHA